LKTNAILVVDDEPDITMTLKMGLQVYGFEADAFNDPILALSSFRAGLYDLALLDIRMPKMNGFELYKEIEKIDNKVKVCFITAFEVYYESLRELYPDSKVSCFIKKPVLIEKLVDHIKKELGGE
jgi:DNA-binding response OmpR family regulator